MNDRLHTKPAGLSLGLSLVIFGTLALLFSRDIGETGVGSANDPGPRLFPVALSAFLTLWGVIETGRWVVNRVWSSRATSPLADTPTAVPAAALNRWNVLLMIAALCVYIPAINWLGFSLCTFVLATGLIVCLGSRWWLAPIVAVVMVTVVKLLFVGMFKVQLPAGELGLPF